MDPVLFKSYFPELFLSIAIFLQILYNTHLVNNFKYNFPVLDLEVFAQIIFIVASLLLLFLKIKILGFFSNLVFINDNSSKIIKILLTLYFIVLLNILYCSFKIQKINFIEFLSMLMLSILSMYLLIGSCDLISFYLSIEMQSICFYILSSCKKNS